MTLNILGTAAILFVLFARNSDYTSASEGWSRLISALVVLAAIWF